MATSQSDRVAHVALWKESGLSRAAYCRRAGLAYHLLYNWSKDAPKSPSSKSPGGEHPICPDGGFIEVVTGAMGGTGSLTLRLVSGAVLELDPGIKPVWLAQLLREMQAC